jgi:hypothetical protein
LFHEGSVPQRAALEGGHEPAPSAGVCGRACATIAA